MKKNKKSFFMLFIFIVSLFFSPSLVLAKDESTFNSYQIPNIENIEYVNESNVSVLIPIESERKISKITIDNNETSIDNYEINKSESIIIKEGVLDYLDEGNHTLKIYYDYESDNPEIAWTTIIVTKKETENIINQIRNVQGNNDSEEDKLFQLTGAELNRNDYEYYFKSQGKNLYITYVDWADLRYYDEVTITIDDTVIERYHGWNFDSAYSLYFANAFLDNYEIGDYTVKIRAKKNENNYYEEGIITIKIKDLINLTLTADEINLEYNDESEINDVYINLEEISYSIQSMPGGTVEIDTSIVNSDDRVIPRDALIDLYNYQTEQIKTYSVGGTAYLEDSTNGNSYVTRYDTTLTITKNINNQVEYNAFSNITYHMYYRGPVSLYYEAPTDTSVIESITFNGENYLSNFSDGYITFSNNYLDSLGIGSYELKIISYDQSNNTYYKTTVTVYVEDELEPTEYNIIDNYTYHMYYRGPVSLYYEAPTDTSVIESITFNGGDFLPNFSDGYITFSNDNLICLGIGSYELEIISYDPSDYTYYKTIATIYVEDELEPTEYNIIDNYTYHMFYEGPVFLYYEVPTSTSVIDSITFVGVNYEDRYSNGVITISNEYLDNFGKGSYELKIISYDPSDYTYYKTVATIYVEDQIEPTEYNIIDNYTYHMYYRGPIILNYSTPTPTSTIEGIVFNGVNYEDRYSNGIITISNEYLDNLGLGSYELTIFSYNPENYTHYITIATIYVEDELEPTEYNIIDSYTYHMHSTNQELINFELPSPTSTIESIIINGEYIDINCSNGGIILPNGRLDNLGLGSYQLIIISYNPDNYTYYKTTTNIIVEEQIKEQPKIEDNYTFDKNSNEDLIIMYPVPIDTFNMYNIQIDNEVVNSSFYKYTGKITIYRSELINLTLGEHDVTINGYDSNTSTPYITNTCLTIIDTRVNYQIYNEENVFIRRVNDYINALLTNVFDGDIEVTLNNNRLVENNDFYYDKDNKLIILSGNYLNSLDPDSYTFEINIDNNILYWEVEVTDIIPEDYWIYNSDLFMDEISINLYTDEEEILISDLSSIADKTTIQNVVIYVDNEEVEDFYIYDSGLFFTKSYLDSLGEGYHSLRIFYDDASYPETDIRFYSDTTLNLYTEEPVEYRIYPYNSSKYDKNTDGDYLFYLEPADDDTLIVLIDNVIIDNFIRNGNILTIPKSIMQNLSIGNHQIDAHYYSYGCSCPFEVINSVKGSLFVTIKDEDNKSVKDVTIYIYNVSNVEVATIVTDENGQANINNLPLATYNINYVGNAHLEPIREQIVLNETNPSLLINKLLNYYRTYVEFDVFDEFYKALKNVTIEIYDINDNFVGRATSNDEGIVIIENVRSGNNYYKVVDVPEELHYNSDKKLFNASSELINNIMCSYNEVFILDNNSYKQGLDTEITGTIYLGKDYINKVLIDDIELDNTQFSITESGKYSQLTINKNYLDQLSLGSHTITIKNNYYDFTANIEITKINIQYNLISESVYGEVILLIGNHNISDDRDYIIKLDGVEKSYHIRNNYFVLDETDFSYLEDGMHKFTLTSYYGYGEYEFEVSRTGKTDINEIINLLPGYYFVSTKEIEAFSNETKQEIKEEVISILEENNININELNYDIDVKVNELNHIFEGIITFTNKNNNEDFYTTKGQIVYTNSDNYIESDNEIVKNFIDNNELVFTKYYNYGDNFDINSHDTTGVEDYLNNKFKDTNIKYLYKAVGYTDDNNYVGNVFLFINDKYYGVQGIIIYNGIKINIPFNIKDNDKYILEELSKFIKDQGIDEELKYENEFIQSDTKKYLKVSYTKEKATIDDIKELINREYSVDLSEDNVNTYVDGMNSIVGNNIISQIKKLLLDNNVNLDELKYTLYVEEGDYNYLNNIYDIYIANIYLYNENNLLFNLLVPIKYNNTNSHIVTEEETYNNFLSNSLKFTLIKDIEEPSNINYYDYMQEELTKLINDENIKVRVLNLFAGSEGYIIEWPYLFFINNKYYGLVMPELTIKTRVEVPYNVNNQEEYVLSKLRKYYVDNNYTDNEDNIYLSENYIMNKEYEEALGILEMVRKEPVVYNISLDTNKHYLNTNTPINIELPSNLDIIKVLIDNDVINYTKNNLVIIISSNVLNNLSIGTHTIKIETIDGYGTKDFDILKKEITLDDLVKIFKNPLNINIDEINVFDSITVNNKIELVIHNEISNSLNKIIENNSDLKDENITYEISYNGYTNLDIYKANITFKNNNNVLGTIELDLLFKNTNSHTSDEQKFIDEFISNDLFNFVVTIEEDEQYFLSDLIENLATQNGIEVREALPPLTVLSKNIPYALFINKKYYGITYANLKKILKVKVAYNEPHTDQYVIERVQKYYHLENFEFHIEGNLAVSNAITQEFVIERNNPVIYKDITENNLIYEKQSDKGLTIVFDKVLNNVIKISLNDTEISKDNYIIDSNKIIISNTYLDNVINNRYKLYVNTLDGYGNTTITVIPKQYVYLEGANAVVIKSEDDSLVVRINAEIYKFLKVYINGQEIDMRFYTLREGSTIIDFVPEFIKTLKAGKYELKALFTDGEATTNFIIEDEEVDEEDYLLESNISNYIKGSNKDIEILINKVGTIENISINNNVLTENDYYVNENIIIIRNSFLEKLSIGNKNIEIIFEKGSINSTFEVIENKKETATKEEEKTTEEEEKTTEEKEEATVVTTTVITTAKTYHSPYEYSNSDNNTNIEKVDNSDKKIEKEEEKEKLQEVTKDIGKVKEKNKVIKEQTNTSNKKLTPTTILFIIIVIIFIIGISVDVIGKNTND